MHKENWKLLKKITYMLSLLKIQYAIIFPYYFVFVAIFSFYFLFHNEFFY